METKTVYVGLIVAGTEGFKRTRKVKFTGEKLATYSDQANHRGLSKTLYRNDDGELLLHVRNWSNWQNESTNKTLKKVTEDYIIEDHPVLAQQSGIKDYYEVREVV